MAKSKAKSSRTQPLTISIHGKGIDIDASFQDNSTMGEAIGAIASRIAGVATPPFVEAAMPPPNPFRDLVVAFAQTIRPDQIPTLQGALDPEQKIIAMEILFAVAPDVAGRPNGATNVAQTAPAS
jgi:hypothetical protein